MHWWSIPSRERGLDKIGPRDGVMIKDGLVGTRCGGGGGKRGEDRPFRTGNDTPRIGDGADIRHPRQREGDIGCCRRKVDEESE